MSPSPSKVDRNKLTETVDAICAQMLDSEDWGTASTLTPQLKDIDTKQFGLAVCISDDEVVTGGSADKAFTIQSISKVFSLTIALEVFGDKVWERVGREPSGDPYNSLVDLESHEGYPRNPFINAGALVVNDMLHGLKRDDGGSDTVRELIEALLDGEKVGIDDDVANSEGGSNFANRAMANLSKHFNNFRNDVEPVLKDYIHQCSLSMSCRQVARAGRYLMVERTKSENDDDLRRARRVRRINALMLTCGQYDGSGDFAFRVGLPAKSGVGGGILAIVPNVASICVWSPGLDENGNSLLGTKALEMLSERMDWSVFGALKN